MWALVFDYDLDDDTGRTPERLVELGADGSIGREIAVTENTTGASENAHERTIVFDDAGNIWARGEWIARETYVHGLIRLDAENGTRTLERDVRVSGIAHLNGETFVSTFLPGDTPQFFLQKIDEQTANPVQSVPIKTGRVVSGAGALWLLGDSEVTRVDPVTLAMSAPITVPHRTARAIGGPDALWVWEGFGKTLTAVRADGSLSTTELPSSVLGIAPDDTGAWTSHWEERVLRRIEGGRVTRTIDVGEEVYDIALDGDGRIWVATRDGVLAVKP
jgi:hypothetical protein